MRQLAKGRVPARHPPGTREPGPGTRGLRLGSRDSGLGGSRSEMTVSEQSPVKAGQRPQGLAPTRQVLPNGVTVIAKETRTTPAVTIYAAVHAGTLYDPPGATGLAHFVARTIDRGTAAYSGDQIAEEL